jgi:phage tail-like protein
MQFLYALERVLDPYVAIIDSLGAYLSPRLAPEGMVDAMAAWLGLALEDAPAEIDRREVLAHAPEVAQWRGTRHGLELALRVCFPDLHMRVEDRGRVVFLGEGATPPESYPGFVVRCREPLTPNLRAAVEWVIERQRPLQVLAEAPIDEDASVEV